MRRTASALLAIALTLTGTAFAHGGKCGMHFAIQNSRQPKSVLHPAAASRVRDCDAREYYDSVYTRETEHFQIFYTLGRGPHATTPEFVDSLATTLESAYKFHTKTMGMRTPLGLTTTSHYQMPVKEGFYPVEVAELDFLRDPMTVLKAYACNGCYGITHATSSNHQESEILIDNDFKYVQEGSTATESTEHDGKTCSYPASTATLYNTTYQYSYYENFGKALRVTIFHEMFHAVQLRYMNLYEHATYWAEASASANEELGAPDINDYFLYINRFFNFTGTPLDELSDDYSIAILYLYLYTHVDKHFDKDIWEFFEAEPETPFKEHLKKIFTKRGLDGDSVFHDFATAVAFSGKNAKGVSKSRWIYDDQPEWGHATAIPTETVKDSTDHDRFVPEAPLYAFNFYRGGVPNIDKFKGKASALIFNNDKIDIRRISSTSTLDSVLKDSFFADSIMWVFSSFDNPKIIPEIVKDSTLRVYPMPWRGNGPLCFTPLPESKKFIEIRNARGDLVMREPYGRTTHCIDADNVKALMKPGVYRFRTGSSGKTQKFIVTY